MAWREIEGPVKGPSKTCLSRANVENVAKGGYRTEGPSNSKQFYFGRKIVVIPTQTRRRKDLNSAAYARKRETALHTLFRKREEMTIGKVEAEDPGKTEENSKKTG